MRIKAYCTTCGNYLGESHSFRESFDKPKWAWRYNLTDSDTFVRTGIKRHCADVGGVGPENCKDHPGITLVTSDHPNVKALAQELLERCGPDGTLDALCSEGDMVKGLIDAVLAL